MNRWDKLHFLTRLAALALLSIAAFAKSEGPGTCRILIVGDSISSGYGLPESENWVARFKNEVQYFTRAEITNRSVPRIGIDDAIEMFRDESVAASGAEVTILQVGSNDGLLGSPIPDIRRSLETLINSVDSSRLILISAFVPADYGQSYRRKLLRLYEDASRERRVELVDIPIENYINEPEYFQEDRLHPNARGHEVIFEAVLETFKGAKGGVQGCHSYENPSH